MSLIGCLYKELCDDIRDMDDRTSRIRSQPLDEVNV